MSYVVCALNTSYDLYRKIPSDTATAKNPRYDLIYCGDVDCIVEVGNNNAWGKFGQYGAEPVTDCAGEIVLTSDDCQLL